MNENDFHIHRLGEDAKADAPQRRSTRRTSARVQSSIWNRVLLHRWTRRAAVIITIVIALDLAYVFITLPDVADPRSLLASQSTVVLDRHGTELYRFYQEEDRTFLPGEQMPEYLKQAIVAIEDERYEHRGCLDFRAILRAIAGLGRSGGASTITRQLARTALHLRRDNIYNRKLKEFILGCQMESRYGKEDLLELYLNWIPFGPNTYGVEQASQEYFSISASEISLAQSAILAAMPQRPSYFTPYGSHRYTTVTAEVESRVNSGHITSVDEIPDSAVRIGLLGTTIGTGSTVVYIGGRTDQVLANMQQQGRISEQERLAALSEISSIVFQPAREDIRAPHFVLWVREQVEELFAGTAEEGLLEHGGLRIETTLDWDIQQAAEEVIAFHKEDLLTRYVGHNIALVAMDPASRDILAYVGNTDYHDQDHGGKIDMARVPRQPGSSFKPFVYAAAFERDFTPGTVLFDVPTKIGDDEPQNFDSRFLGPLTARYALGHSRNVPAAKAFFLAGGEENILQLSAALGASTPLERRAELREQRNEEYSYGWPLALGAAETPLLEMVHAYSTFADAGRYRPYISIRKIYDKNDNILFESKTDPLGKQVIDPRIAHQITSILSDESARPAEEYWRTQLTIPGYQTAGKTGTSNKCMEWKENTCLLRKPDNAWLLGYTPAMVAGVWVGNANSSAMYEKGGGLNTASPIWRDFLMRAHRKLTAPTTTFSVPSGIVQSQISLLSGQLPTECTPVELRRAEVFLEENAPTQPDPACRQLTVDKVTGLLASDSCPIDAREEGSFFLAQSILPDRWPFWEEGVQKWMEEQMEIWNATPNHSGSLLPLPRAPLEECSPELTPGRLQKPKIRILYPSSGDQVSYPAFLPKIDFEVGSSVRSIKFFIGDIQVEELLEPPFDPVVRVRRAIKETGIHQLRVVLEDEYFNRAEDRVTFSFGQDDGAPTVRLRQPADGSTFNVGETILIQADASDKDGGIRYVQFYLDDTLLSTKPSPSYKLEYSFTEPGRFRIRAVAEDFAKHRVEDSVEVTVED